MPIQPSSSETRARGQIRTAPGETRVRCSLPLLYSLAAREKLLSLPPSCCPVYPFKSATFRGSGRRYKAALRRTECAPRVCMGPSINRRRILDIFMPRRRGYFTARRPEAHAGLYCCHSARGCRLVWKAPEGPPLLSNSSLCGCENLRRREGAGCVAPQSRRNSTRHSSPLIPENAGVLILLRNRCWNFSARVIASTRMVCFHFLSTEGCIPNAAWLNVRLHRLIFKR